MEKNKLDLIPFVEERKPAIIEADDDVDFARKNIIDIIGKAQSALEDMVDVARQSQSPRAYEVLNSMLKNVGDLSKDLIEIHQRRQDLIKSSKEDPNAPKEVHNHLNITTAELGRMIEDATKK